MQRIRRHFVCYGIAGNGKRLEQFREEVKRLLAPMPLSPNPPTERYAWERCDKLL